MPKTNVAEPDSIVYQINNAGCLETVWRSYKFAIHRHVLFNWALFITEVRTYIHCHSFLIIIVFINQCFFYCLIICFVYFTY